MNLKQTDLSGLLKSGHPSRPFLILGSGAILLGVVRGRLSGLALIGVGVASIYRGVGELKKTNSLHGGNFHGYNRPSQPPLEDRVAML